MPSNSVESLESQLRSLAPLSPDGEPASVAGGVSDTVAVETLGDTSGLNAGRLGRVFVLRPDRYEVVVLPPEPGGPATHLHCSPAPLFPVCSLRLSPDGSLLALFGPRGAVALSVAALGAGTTSRRPLPLLDLSGRAGAVLTQLKWAGPGRLVLLGADNRLHWRHLSVSGMEPARVLARPEAPPLVLGAAPGRAESALREFPVDVAACGDDELFLLTGAGDVLWVAGEPGSARVAGPLRWSPATADNYGCDFCALLCLDAGPVRVLVAATSGGRLFHCLLLYGDADEPPKLATYDAVDLDLRPAVQLSLRPDPALAARYFAAHEAGVHVVHLPWLPDLVDRYRGLAPDTESPGESELSAPEDALPAAASVVEHALCLRPTPGRAAPALAGLALVGPATGPELVCVGRAGELRRCRVRLAGPAGPAGTIADVSPDAAPTQDALLAEVRRLLAHDALPPLLLAGAGPGAGPREALALVERSAARLRTQYLDRFEEARALLRRRVELLAARRKVQAGQLAALEGEIDAAAKESDAAVARVVAAVEAGDRLRERLARAGERAACLLPRGGREEERRRADWRRLAERSSALRQWVERTQDKSEFCERLRAEERRAPRRPGPGGEGNMQAALGRQVRSVLKEEGDRIGRLIQALQGLQAKVEPSE